jgi:serine/threonine-protein kinase SRPK3
MDAPEPAVNDESLYLRACQLLSWEESPRKYCTGGFHPVILWDTFKDGRYTVRHKLGNGSFSTTWVARDNACVPTLLFVMSY